VQQLRPAFDTKAEHEWRIVDALTASLTGVAPHASIAHVRKAIMDGVMSFGGVDLLKLGATGTRTSGQTVAT
jgi:hypothetical protein